MSTCPECKGKGHYWERSVEERGRREKFDCWLCRTSGYVTSETEREWRVNHALVDRQLETQISEALDTQKLARAWKSHWDIKKTPREPAG